MRATQKSSDEKVGPRLSACGTLAAFLCCWLLIAAAAGAQPSDPFVGPSATAEAKQEEPLTQNVGDWGVAEQRGAATYTLPIEVPRGRNAMSPALMLRYSSQGRLRGAIAVGWSMDLPNVRIDTSLGAEAQTHFAATLGSVSGGLVEVPDRSPYGGKAYRVDFDGSFTRFFRAAGPAPSGWVALTPDGIRHFFEEEPGASDGSTRWSITRQVDPFGNTVRYFWATVLVPGGNRGG